VRVIKAVLFDPVGCLAEFPAAPFSDIAAQLFDEHNVSESGSDAYWEVLDLLEAGTPLTAAQTAAAEALELRAVEEAQLYEDVGPSLGELKGMGISLVVASSLSEAAVRRFLGKFAIDELFSAVWSRDNAGGVKTVPLARAIEGGAFQPDHVMSLADTTQSIEAAKGVGAQAILMFNDYDEGKRLAAQGPAGGIVSLHELPDAIRFVAEGDKRR
jgi:phosphoglycolate phosphatase-like HAD superfamily hydrolase